MNIRYVVSAAIVAAVVAVSPVYAQQPSTTEQSTAEQVKTWSQKQWNMTKAEFAKDKAKWASCRQQSEETKLSGRASWSFLYSCMTS